MTVATLRLVLLVNNCHAPREKRRRVRAIMEKLHRHFNISVAEMDHDEEPAQAVLAVVAVGRTRREVHDRLDRVAAAVAAHPRAALLSHVITEV